MSRLRVIVPVVFVLLALVVPGVLGQSDSAEGTPTPPPEPSPSDPQPMEYEEWKTVTPGQHPGYNQRVNLAQRGYRVYEMYCAGCHGDSGDGKGPASPRLITKPRDFTSGIYKFRTTDSGSLPMEADMMRTITRGLPRASMPAFPLMSQRDKLAVIEYIKGFYPDWEAQKDSRTVVHVSRAPTDLGETARVLRGRVVYLEMQCSSCHGIDGQGTGATQSEYVDAWGNEQKAFNFTRGSLKGGDAPEDIYRTFHTGLRSVMPAYGGDTLSLVTQEGFGARSDQLLPGEAELLQSAAASFPETGAAIFAMPESERLGLAERNSWDLVSYILSLRTRTTTAAAVLGSEPAGR